MPPSLNLGSPIILDLDALLGRQPCEVIDLHQVKAPPKDAILVDDIDPMTVLIAGARRKMGR